MAPSGQLSDGCRSLQCPRGHGRVQRIDCGREERKHLIAEEYLREYAVGLGVFLILIARAPAPVWDVSPKRHLRKRQSFVNRYSFHIMDPVWGRVTIKMSGHPPFGARVP